MWCKISALFMTQWVRSSLAFSASPSVARLASSGELGFRSAYALEAAEERTFSYFAFGHLRTCQLSG